MYFLPPLASAHVARPGHGSVINSVGMKMVLIPGGSFLMGNEKFADGRPVHRVLMSPFYMAETEVTRAQFAQFSKATLPPGAGPYPIGGVSRRQVAAFARWLSRREKRHYSLPSDAQWEYAARGGIVGADYPWGNGIDKSQTVIGPDKVRPVKSFAPNNFGLYDMCGNLAEMVREGPYYYSTKVKRDPVGPQKGTLHYVRGLGVGLDMPWLWFRSLESDEFTNPDTGFRLIMGGKPKPYTKSLVRSR
jgi:formylglycine-generating enzyme required for sulfatase activity